ncbi:MAG: LPS assembly protein LptD, partial [Rubripirellula sp.]
GTSSPPQVETINRPELGETVIVARGGMTVLIRDVTAQLPSGEQMQLGTVSISADRVVGWLPLVANLFNGAEDLSDAQGELYLEGDIVFRQGERIIYADSMYYNVGMERGLVLDAEAITPMPNSMGLVRLKADVLQQVAKGNFIAFDAAITSSRLGVPRYWLQSEQLTLREREQVKTNASGVSVIHREPFVDSRNNFVYLSGVPVLYWPKFSTSLERPTSYVSSVDINSDGVFGTQYLLDLDLFQLLGIQSASKGLDWELSLDYFTDRGFAAGTNFEYQVSSFLGTNHFANGSLDAWFIHDGGLDTLGSLRKNLIPETQNRGRVLLRHRQSLGAGNELTAELGWVSDRNFLEQFLENEWDQNTDHRTEIHLKRYRDSHLLDFTVSARLNDFYTATEKLPQLDYYLLGGSLLGDRLTASAHTKVGYQRLNQADNPEDPSEALLYSPVPGEVGAKGVVASTRQEISLPFQVGPVRVVPSLSGEAAHYGQDSAGEPLTRLLGQAGITASLSAWKVDPSIQSALLNVRGLAHKLEWVAGYHYADSNVDLEQLPLYDPLDDNSQEQFRSRYITTNFSGVLDPRFDPRYFALRQGFQWLVASPSDIVAADLQQFRLGLHQRWQTKRGLQGKERIVDLLEFDVDTSLFPQADRDNFSETIGPTTYNLTYHIGDRFAVLSDGYFDFFTSGLQSVSAGVRSSRPGVGDLYVGLLSLRGPVSSTVVRANFDYRMNEKWIATAGTAYDFDETGNIGQTVAFTRIGESMLLRVGVNIDEGRDNVGVGFSIEPRFWPSPQLGRIGGGLIPPPGLDGLE